jgi:flavodoxin/ferredoxin
VLRSLVIYFSQGGTTERISRSIVAGLAGAGYEVDLCNLAQQHCPAPTGYDLLGIGSPTYYYRPPFKVIDYIDNLPALCGLPAFVFVLHGTYLGDGGNTVRDMLAARGAEEVGYFVCRGADYYLSYLKQGYLFSPDHPRHADLTRGEAFGRDVAARAAGQPYTRPAKDPSPTTLHRFERFLATRFFVNQLYSRLFRVDRGQCIACGACAEVCPTSNITLNEAGQPVWGRECELCLYCEMECPQAAITSPASSWVSGLFARHNVQQAVEDPRIDQARVRRGKGYTERLT